MNCRHCGKKYERLFYLKRHEACCEILHSSADKRDRILQENTDLPSPVDCYIVLQEVVSRLSQLENRLQKLENNQPVSRKKGIQLLLDSKPAPQVSLQEWVSNIEPVKESLEKVMTGSFATVIAKEIVHLIETSEDTLPIAVTNKKENAIYGFENGKWNELELDTIRSLYMILSGKIFNLFKNWQDDLGDKIYTESGSRLYHKGVQVIMNGSQCKPSDLSKFRQAIHSNFPQSKRI